MCSAELLSSTACVDLCALMLRLKHSVLLLPNNTFAKPPKIAINRFWFCLSLYWVTSWWGSLVPLSSENYVHLSVQSDSGSYIFLVQILWIFPAEIIKTCIDTWCQWLRLLRGPASRLLRCKLHIECVVGASGCTQEKWEQHSAASNRNDADISSSPFPCIPVPARPVNTNRQTGEVLLLFEACTGLFLPNSEVTDSIYRTVVLVLLTAIRFKSEASNCSVWGRSYGTVGNSCLVFIS